MDKVSKKTRSRMMASVGSKDTYLELEIRRRLFGMGFRYRLHRKDLPGKPDIVFPKYSAVILIHGCFWHQHWCDRSKLPDTRKTWWKNKLGGNRKRDAKNVRALRELSWRVLIVWECSVRRPGVESNEALGRIAERAARFLKSTKSYLEIPGTPRKRKKEQK